ncbi:MAG: hypothetical protein WA517_11190 [Candidatus Acidiferrum sp.]
MKANFYPASANVDFRVNGIEFRQGQLRSAGNDPTDFEIVIKHPFLGIFAVHEGFVFELCLGDGSGTWKKVTLEQLKRQFLLAASEVPPWPGGGEYESAGEKLGKASEDWLVAHRKSLPRIPVEGDAGHIQRAEEAFVRARVRFQIVGGLGSAGRVWGHATFQVDSPPRARRHLRCAGFLQCAEAQYVLIDSANGWKIRLL